MAVRLFYWDNTSELILKAVGSFERGEIHYIVDENNFVLKEVEIKKVMHLQVEGEPTKNTA